MSAARLALAAAAAAALLLCARADSDNDDVLVDRIVNLHLHRVHDAISELPSSCLYEGRWHKEGATVLTREDCLRCVCMRGTLTCRRRACAPLPDPLPRRCHVRHRRGACCPELHCPGEQQQMEHGASAVFESADYLDSQPDVATPSSVSNACVEGGTVYAAGSAMGSRVACEQCFCLRGTRRCVVPSCLPPPPHCAPRPAPGACCPDRYYCDRPNEDPLKLKSQHDCEVNGKLVLEGERVPTGGNCSACFCLHGEVHCQALGCAPPLSGCRPLLALGDCCAHQYICDHSDDSLYSHGLPVRGNSLMPARYDNRAFHSSNTNRMKATTAKAVTRVFSSRQTPITSATKNFITTTKVKRKTDERHLGFAYVHEHSISDNVSNNITTTEESLSAQSLLRKLQDKKVNDNEEEDETEDNEKTNDQENNKSTENDENSESSESSESNDEKEKNEENENDENNDNKEDNENNDNNDKKGSSETNDTVKDSKSNENNESSDKDDNDNEEVSTAETTEATTEQPEGTVKIMINGTINCTAELSSTSLPLSITYNDTDKIQMEAMPRIPIVNIEAQTYSPNDIITDRNVNGGFDENDTFTINVTSSLMTNASRSTAKPVMSDAEVQVPQDIVDSVNSSKKTKEDYDYDYDAEPTLPPSLPNLKIIPFVAADAVVDDPIKEAFPILEREDKYPVYYPSGDTKDSIYATRREDNMNVLPINPTQYPVFISDKEKHTFQLNTHEVPVDITSSRYPLPNDVGVHEFTVSTSLGHKPDILSVTKEPTTSTTYKLETPAVNLFSPPVETEGGFIPKGPGIIDDYFPAITSTPSPVVPHLTTSMQLDFIKGECVSSDGRVVPQGQSITVACMECTCTWQRLRCAPRICLAMPGCRRRPAPLPTVEPCCNDLDCTPETINTTAPVNSDNYRNETKDENKMTSTLSSTTPSVHNITFTDIPKTNEITTASTTKVNTSVVTKPPKTNMDSVQNTTSSTLTSTTKLITKLTTTSTPATITQTNDTSQEYDDDDDGFSFGSVLKLLLSDTYDSTTTAPYKKSSTKLPPNPTYPPTMTTRKPPPIAPFIPLPPHPYIPPKMTPNTVNRIDHLVLGEATAIKRTTPKPITNKTKHPMQTDTSSTPATHVSPWPPNLGGISGAGPGLLKLAGCNIYGRMYRVGRIIAELSTPCQECWCTELGVQCNQLGC